jgi:dephospho-CoA kinase
VRKKFEFAVSSLKDSEVLVYEIPLLVETKSQDRFDLVITVESEYENRVERLRSRGMQKSEIDARMAAQATRPEREEVADFLIENNGNEDELLRQVENIWDSINDTL